MKLVLCSEGFSTPNTIKACVDLVGKPQDKITVAVINEAYAVERGDKRWVLSNLQSVTDNFPADMDIINLLALPLSEIEERITQEDVIFVVGGHTDYLMHVFNKTGFSKILPKLLDTKVYVGSSAGSMVLGKRISHEAYAKVYYEEGDYNTKEYMGLVDLALKPHMGSDNFPNNRPEILQKVASGMDFPVYGISDGCALVVDGEKQEFIGPKPYKVQ